MELFGDWKAKARKGGVAASGVLTLVAFWWWVTRGDLETGAMAPRFAPGLTFESLGEILAGSDLTRHALVSLRRIFVGLAAALALGIPLGLVIGSFHLLARATSVAFQFLRMISPLSLMPMAVMAFGVGDRPIYYLLSFVALWPVVLSTGAGVRALDERLLELGRSLSASRVELLWEIIVPGVLGHLLTGTRLAIGVLWIVLVPCEMLGVSAGLGYYILDARDRLAYSELMAMILVIGGLGFLLDASARALCARFGAEVS